MALQFFAFSLGLLTVGVAGGLFLQQRKTSIGFFLLFVIGFTLDTLSLLGWSYITAAGLSSPGSYFVRELVNKIAGILMASALPGLAHSVLVTPYRRAERVFLAAVLSVQGLLTVAHLVTLDILWLGKATKIPLYVSVIYTLAFSAIRFRTIGNAIVRRAFLIVFAIATLQIPVILLKEYVFDILPNRESGVVVILSSPSLLIAIAVVGLFFTIRFFGQPAYMRDGRPTDHFVDAFGISKREQDIVQHLLIGETNEQIAAALFISPHTVNRHVYSIYRKLNVKNRVQLLNLLRSREG